MLRRDSVEIDELRHPIHVDAQRLVPDSEGAGRYRGAPGAYVEYGPSGTSLTVAYGSRRRGRTRRSGRAAACPVDPRAISSATARARSRSCRRRRSWSCRTARRIVSVTAGGGGYGPPAERDPERVRHDVVEGWVSRERAREVYRVALGADLSIDAPETAVLRLTTTT